MEQVASNFQTSGNLGVITMVNESGKDLELYGIINGLSAITAEIASQHKVPLLALLAAIREVVAARYHMNEGAKIV